MDVTYYVALPFVMADDGPAPGEATECLSANAAVMRAEALSRKPGCESAPNLDPSHLNLINYLGRRSAFGPHAE